MDFHGTTILGVKRNGKTVICGDGQVTMGETVFKGNAKKVRRLGEGKVISGFAGSVADALALYERFEGKYKSSHGKKNGAWTKHLEGLRHYCWLPTKKISF